MIQKISKNLYYGGIEAAGDREQYREYDIGHAIQLTYEEPENGYPPEVTVHTFSMMDGPQNDEDVFRSAVAKVVALLRDDAKILVHCSAGESRSACVAAAALGRFESMSFDEALAKVRKAGPVNAHESLLTRGRTYCSK